MLFDVVPIGGLDCASPACCRGLGNAPRPVGALLVAGWILILKDFLGPEIGKCLVALISQEQCFSAIADKHQGIVRNFWLVHMLLLENWALGRMR